MRAPGIRPYWGEWLFVPWSLHLDVYPCRNRCAYCFTRWRGQKGVEKKSAEWWRGAIHTKSQPTAAFVRRRAVVVASNTTDVFSLDELAFPALDACLSAGLGIYYQTRGGDPAMKWVDRAPVATWYVSVTHDGTDAGRQLEPGTPDYHVRMALIEKLRERGCPIIVGINPYIADLWRDIPAFIRRLSSLGVCGIWGEPLHLPRNLADVPAASRKLLPNVKDVDWDSDSIPPELIDHDIPVYGQAAKLDSPSRLSSFWDEPTRIYREAGHYLQPTIWDWFAGLTSGADVSCAQWREWVRRQFPNVSTSEVKNYVCSVDGRGEGGSCRSYTFADLAEFVWDHPSIKHALWKTEWLSLQAEKDSDGELVELVDSENHRWGIAADATDGFYCVTESAEKGS